MPANVQQGETSERAGWAMVLVLVVVLFGFPIAILYWPPTFVPYRDAFLGLAMVPAIGFGLIGVYTAVKARTS
jgi:polyferredoxin